MADSPESEEAESSEVDVWALVWTLVVMKVVTIALVVLAARNWESGALFALITWHWLLVLGVLVAAPLVFQLRLRRVRRRRAMLLRSEWMVSETDAPARRHQTVARSSPGSQG